MSGARRRRARAGGLLLLGVCLMSLSGCEWQPRARPMSRTAAAKAARKKRITYVPRTDPQTQAALEEARQHEAANRYREAAAVYEQVLAREPERMEVYLKLARCYQTITDYPKAVEALENALSLEPQWADAYEVLGEVHVDAGRLDAAEEVYHTLQRLNLEKARALKLKINEARKALEADE